MSNRFSPDVITNVAKSNLVSQICGCMNERYTDFAYRENIAKVLLKSDNPLASYISRLEEAMHDAGLPLPKH